MSCLFFVSFCLPGSRPALVELLNQVSCGQVEIEKARGGPVGFCRSGHSTLLPRICQPCQGLEGTGSPWQTYPL
ncbi:hypothetical protein BGZ57DRAFT_886539 [Hyaloscypha finlandica]|nr:hypothetical protein BGZ57DRAFT_886539 [Hyaloscypha finlandica]